MPAKFQSAATRSLFGSLAMGLAIDAVAMCVITSFFNDTWQSTLISAAVALALLYAVQLLYGLFSALRTLALYYGWQREKAAEAMAAHLAELGLPRPSSFYLDPEEYLAEVVADPDASTEAKLFAGSAIGRLYGLRETSHPILALTYSDTLELAITSYSVRKSGPTFLKP